MAGGGPETVRQMYAVAWRRDGAERRSMAGIRHRGQMAKVETLQARQDLILPGRSPFGRNCAHPASPDAIVDHLKEVARESAKYEKHISYSAMP